jgi:hypothetical protein
MARKNRNIAGMTPFFRDYGGAFDRLGSRTKTSFLYVSPGKNGESDGDADNQAALQLAGSVAREESANKNLEAARGGTLCTIVSQMTASSAVSCLQWTRSSYNYV